MRKNFFAVAICIALVFALCACGKKTPDTYETSYNYSVTESTTLPTYGINTESAYVSGQQSDTATVTAVTPTAAVQQPNRTEPHTSEAVTVPQTTEKVYEKTGDMAFSDSADNKYIKAVSSKYGVEPKKLAALYTVPDNDGNIVLEFDGSVTSDGKLIRTEDTLVAIYSVDRDLNCKRASENRSLNEYSYGEMKVMFISVKKYIMPEFASQLNG